MNRTLTIIHAIAKRNYNSYLELGCKRNETFDAVSCARKVGVDSVQGGTVRMTTDDFFTQNTETFDIVFIDAYHHHDQVLRDFENSLKVLNPGGTVVLHDCNPGIVADESQKRCGTAWRAFARHIRTRSDLNAIVADFDHGVGLVRVEPNQFISTLDKSMEELTYDDLANNRDQYLRLHTWEYVQYWL